MAANITLNLGFERGFGGKQIKRKLKVIGANLRDYANGSDTTNTFRQVVNCCDFKIDDNQFIS